MVTVSFLLQMIKYWLISDGFHKKREMIYYGRLFMITVIVFGINFLIDAGTDKWKILIFLLEPVVAFFVFQNYYKKEKIIYVFGISLCLLINEIVGFVNRELFPKEWIADETVNNILFEGGTLFITALMWLFLRIRGRKEKDYKPDVLQKRLFIFSIVLIVELVFVITFLNFSRQFIPDTSYDTTIIVLCGLSYLSVAVLVMLIYYVRESNKKLSIMVENEKELNRMQTIYYDTLLEKEQDTRKFRHDIRNHLICLDGMAHEIHNDAIIEYLQQMQNGVEVIQNGMYHTGIKMLDILMSYYLNKLPKDVKISVIGKADLNLENMKICTIFSNLLNNAVEEVNRIQDIDAERFIKVELKSNGSLSVISITNTATEKKIVDHMISSKKEEGHGVGLENVKRVIREVGGTLELISTDNSFQAIVVLYTV